MPDERTEPVPHRELIEAFAHGKLNDAQRREAESVLEQSEPARELFRQLTAGRYPRLPNYTIIGQVGKGGFGVVYKAIHHAKERIEALKVLFSKTPLLTAYFENEVHLIARLRHANIATLYDAQLSTPPLYYTMEFVEGERLNDYLKGHEVSLAERIDVIKSVAQAVGYAHGQGVVHRDLKPQNVLMDGDGQPHIVDFGIAKKLALVEAPPRDAEEGSGKNHEGPVGTLGYIAPEQEKGGPVDERADVFALGALLFHCVTGEPARLANVDDQRLRVLRERQVPQSEDLSAIIARCVEAVPDRRYLSCADFVSDLENYLASRPIVARQDPSLSHQVFRIAAFVMRSFPVAVRTSVLILVAGFLTWLFWTMETNAAEGRPTGSRTVMIGFADSTLDAIEDGLIGADLPDLDTIDHQTWRMLYGRLMEKLAVTRPLMVVWDGWLDECSKQPEYDSYLLRGLREIRTWAPVIVAANEFDINGEPKLCDDIRPEIDGYGTVWGADAGKHRSKYELAFCIQRGYELPIPGMALAAFAAYRYPKCDLRFDLDSNDRQLHLRYRRRQTEGAPPHWEDAPYYFPLHDVEVVEDDQGPFKPLMARSLLKPGDKVAHALVPARPNTYWNTENRTIAFEDVLAADPPQLKAWFDGKAIVVGHMRRRFDQHKRGDGEEIFGCQLHAEAIDALLARNDHHRFSRRALAVRNGFWCSVAVLLVSMLGRRKWSSVRGVTLVCSLLFLIGGILGGTAGIRVDDPWLLELWIAATGLLTAGSLAFWTKAVRERQMGLTPSAATLTTEGPTLASTVLAETR